MSIDTLPEQTGGTPDTPTYTSAVRVYLTNGVRHAVEAVEAAERHLADIHTRRAAVELELDKERAAAEKHLEDMVRSRDQLLALVGKDEAREPGEQELPTHVCHCARIAVVDPVLGPVHEVNGTRLPAMEACKMPSLGFLGVPGRVAGGEGSVA
ncbi:hypothetical protein [Nonomuraea basaltis]|uniref:hypothetical protein n=1 Tax=Nonomuraea basaltis TaxID=2495887 RepID=UPI00110C55C6|nr:hypothetical protein [Nonomuraea basaltis]TMR90531.1 hypothetical protein EJK15_54800 [Nonomuraea basaltis]